MKKLLFILTTLTLLCLAWGGAVKAQQNLPYSYGFEDYDLTVDGWTAQISSEYSGFRPDAAHGESDYGFCFAWNEQNGFLVSPELSGTGAGVILSFYYKEYSDEYGDEEFYVGYTTDENETNPSNFIYGEITTASLSWQQYEISLPAGTKRIAIQYVFNNAYYLFLDDFTFVAPAGCVEPASINVTALTSSSISISWPAGNANSWNVYLNGTITGDSPVSLNSYTFENLTEDENYTIGVSAACGSEESDVTTTTVFLCVPAPYSVDGSGITNVTFGGMEDVLSMTQSPYYYDHSNQIGAASPGGTVNMSIVYATNYGYHTWVWVDWNQDHTFSDEECVYTSIETISSGPLELSFDVPDTIASGYYRMRIQGADDAGKKDPCYKENYSYLVDYMLHIEVPSQVPAVGDNWSDDFEAAECGWEFVNGDPDNSNVWVCGTGVSYGSGTKAMYISDDGNTYQYNNLNTSFAYATKLLRFTENKFEFSFDWNAKGESSYDYLRAWLAPGDFQFIAGQQPDGSTDFYDAISLVPEGWIALDDSSKLNTSNEWQTQSVTVNVPAGNWFLVFMWCNDDGVGSNPPAAIDNVSITKVACEHEIENIGLMSNMVTTTNATIIWDAGGAQDWQVQIKANDGDWVDYSYVSFYSSGESELASLSNLSPATHYQVRVRANCGNEQYGTWSDAVSFTTKCEPRTVTNANKFEENFDTMQGTNYADANNLPACWNYINTCYNYQYRYYPYVYNESSSEPNVSKSSPNHLRFYSAASASSTSYNPKPQYAILPPMQNISNLRIKFYARANSTENNYDATFKVGVLTNPNDASTFTEIATYTPATTTYELYTIPFNTYSGNGNYIAIMIDAAEVPASGYFYRTMFVDDITVEPIPSCVEPTSVTVDVNGPNSATISWTDGGNTGTPTYIIKMGDTELDGSTTPAVSFVGTTATLTGLTADHNYAAGDFTISTKCSATESSEPVNVPAFNTPCGAITITENGKYNENFDDYTTTATNTTAPSTYPNDKLPNCWKFINRSSTSNTYPAAFLTSYSSYAVSGNCLFFKSSSTTPLYAVLPEFENEISTLQLTFTYRNEGTSAYNGTLYVGYMTDPTDANTFNNDNAIACERTTTKTKKEVSFANAPAGSYLAFKYQGSSSNNMYLSIDNVTVELAPTCLKPSALACDSKTAHTATLSWTNGAEEQNAWQIAYSTSSSFAPANDFTPGENEWLADVTTNPATIEGLDQNTTYYAYVRANCGATDGKSDWSINKVSFSTLAGNITPTGLAVASASITSSQATASWNAVAGNTLHESYDIYWAPATTTEVPAEPAAPNLISGITALSQDITGLDPETSYKVWVRDNCGNDGYSNWSSPVTFSTAADCQTPDGLDTSNVTAHSATITWNTYGQEQFNLRDSIEGETWTTHENVGTSYTFPNNLEGNTTYFVQVQAACNETWSSTLNFKTPCDAITIDAEHHYRQEFESPVTTATYNSTTNLVVPDCWIPYYTNSNYSYALPHIIKSNAGNSYNFSNPASQVLFFYGKDGYVALPEFTNAINTLQISFKWAVENKSYGTLKLGYITAEDNGSFNTFQSIKDLGESSVTTAKTMKDTTFYLNTVPSTATRIVFLWTGTANYYCNIDDVEVSLAPTCFPIQQLSEATSIGTDSAVLNWTLVDNSQTAWDVQYAPNNEFTQEVQTVSADSHENYVLKSLTPATHYYVRVRGNCGNDDTGEWSNVIDFQTENPCAAPTALEATEDQTDQSVLSWTPGANETAWNLYWKRDTAASYIEVLNITDNPYTLPGLTSATNYMFYVKAICGNELSDASEIKSFRTACPTSYPLPFSENFDSYTGTTSASNTAIHPCWTKGSTYSTTENYPHVYTTYKNSSPNSLRFISQSYGSSYNYSSWAVLPKLEVSSTGIMVTFQLASSTTTASYAKMQVGLMRPDEGINSFVAHETFTPSSTYTFTEYTVEFPNSIGDSVLAFYVQAPSTTYGSTYYMYLDDITVSAIPACRPVSSINFSEVERTSMTVSWSAHPLATSNDFQLVYSTTELNETALEAATKIDVEDEIIYHLDNLERNTLYYVYVRGNCGNDGYSEWASATQQTHGLIVCDNPNNVDTVAQGSNSNTYAPVYSNNQEQKERLQVIYPAESLTALVGKRISSIRFYPQYSSVRSGYGDWAENDFRFMLGITTNENLNDGWDNTPIDTVHYGAIATVTANNGMIITFNEPFLYTGGNLLYSMLNPGNNKSAYTSGSSKGVNTEVKYMRYATGSSYLTAVGTAVGYLPQVTFQFCETNDTCPAVTNLQPEGVTTESATIKWSASTGDYVGSYELYYSTEEVTEFDAITPQYTITQGTEQPLTSLTENTTYYVYVKTVCDANNHDDGVSEWAHLQFTTTANCVAPVNVAATLTAKNAANVTWEDGDNDTENNNFQYILSTSQITDFSGIVPTEVMGAATEKSLTGLEYATDYYFYVANNCGNSTSDYTEATFTTAAECPGIQNLTASEIGPNTVKLTWERGQFGEETDWIVYVNNTNPILQWHPTDTAFTAFGLEPETEYSIGVSASCWDEGHSVNTVSPGTEIAVTTAAAPGDCQQVGNGTDYGNMPVTNFDYAYTQMIYTADNFTQSGNITSLKLQRSSYSNVMNNMKVYLGTTTKSTFANSSDWVPEADLTEVYSGSFATGTEWLELDFSTSPFNYNGTDNLVVAISNGHGNWNSIQYFKYTTATKTVLTRRNDNDDSYADYPGTSAGQSPQSERTNIQFCFEPSTCPSVRNLTVEEVTTYSAEISWQPGSSESSWKYYYAPGEQALNDEDLANVNTYTYNAGLSITLNEPLQSNTHYFFYIKPNAGNDCSWQHVDFTTIATCLPPTVNAVEEETITSESAIVSWTANTNSANFDNSISTWILRYRKVNTDEWTVNAISAGETSHSVNGLSGNTTYEVQVSSVCVPNVDTSNWSSSVEFTTKCNPITVDADHSFTENFDATTFPPTACWNSIASGTRNWTRSTTSTYNHSGSTNGSAYSGYYGDIYLLMPNLTISNDNTDVLLTFWSYNTYTGSYDKNSLVLINGDTETELWSPSSVSQAWKCDTINLSSYKGQTISLAFKYEGNNAHGWYVDDIEVAFVPACEIPANLTTSNVTANAATIAWEGNAESYSIHYREVSSFNAIFTEDFEDDATMSNWTLNNCDEGTGVNTVDNNDNAFRFSYNDNPPQYLISPELTGVTEGSKLEFRYKNYQSGYPETFQIGTSSTNNTIDAFTFGTEYTASDVEWHQYSATIPEGTKYICWKYNSNDQYYLYIDDIRVGSVISSNWVDATSTNTSIQLTGLTPGTTYEAEVQSVCGGITSDWSASVNFTPFCNEYLLLTDASNLAVGDKIIIAAANDNAAMSTTQNSNNRGVESIVKNGNTLETPSDEVQILTLAEGSTAGTWALYTGEGYLFAVAASGSNYLRTQETIDANASWTITVSDNKATFKANGSNDKYMRYNNSSSIISCYSSNTTQQPLAIYKFIDNRGKGEDTTIHMVAGSSVTWMGQTFSEYKDYEVVMGTAANGCDSIRVLHVQHKVATPVIDPAAGTYTQPITVTLTCETEGAVIRYSLNGAEETVEYTEPISLSTNGTTTISAFAMKNGIDWERSETVEAEYIIDIQPRTVRFDAGTGSYTGGDLTEATALAGITLPTAEACSTVEGYTFAGWSYEAVATATTTATTLFAAGETFHPATDTILYAVYSKTETGSGSTTTESTVDFSEGSYNNGVITWELSNVVSIVQEQHTGSTAPNSSYVSAPRWYSGNMITITPDVNISSLTVTATSSSYASALNNSTYTNATTSLSGSVVTITPTNGENPITIVMDGQSRISSLAVTYTSTGSGSTTTYNSNPECTIFYHIYTSNNTSANGSFTINPEEAAEGTPVTLTPTVDNHYHLTGWSLEDAQGGSLDITVNPNNNTFNMPASDVYVAMQTAIDQFTITVNAENGTVNDGNGNPTTGGTYDYDTEISLTPVAANGYHFANWTVNGNEVSGQPLVFHVTADSTIVANFELNSYEVTATANPTAGGTITGAGTYTHGAEATLIATVNEGYYFVGWTKNGQTASTSTTYSFTVEGPDNYVANFDTLSYNITATANPTAGGFVTGAGEYKHFKTATLTATANEGYYFVDWTKNGQTASTSTAYSFTVEGPDNYVANFDTISYNITATANPTTGGTVTGAGEYKHFKTVTLTATANEGYYFVGWTKNGQTASTSTTYSFTVEGPDNYIANFDTISYNITATANPTAGGTVTGAGEYKHFKTVTLTASANEGYYFVSWTKDGQTVSTSTAYTITVGGAENYVANFDTISYNIAATANPAAGGSITGAGSYKHFTTATLTATANTGYTFTNWTEGTTVVSSDATYEFTVTGERTLKANFTLNSYNITATANPAAGGTMSGAGTYTHGQSVTLTANPATGYAFVNWTKDNVLVSSNATYTFTAVEAGEYVATFSQNSYAVTVSADPTNGGTVSGDGNYVHGQSATLNATANTGYTFTNWTKNGTVVSTNATYSFTVTGPVDYVAHFTLNSYTVSATAEPTNGGSVTGTGTYNHGASATLTAIPATGYSFVNWTKNGNPVSTDASYSFTVTEAATFVANFSQNSYMITATANPAAGGSVNGAGPYTHGTTANLVATANPGYTFTNWTKNGTVVSTNANYSFTVTEAADYVANFSQNVYAISASANPAAGGTVTGAGNYNYGATATLTANANEGYTFTNWTKNGTVVSTNATYTFTVEAAGAYVANFTLNSYAINASANPTAGGTITGAGTYNHGATANLKATPATGYTFTNWTKNGIEVSTNANYSFTVTEAATYVANFSQNSYAITTTANPTEGGTLTGAGSYNYGATATLTATANTGYTFTNWTKNGNVVSSNASYTITVTEAAAYVANFSLNSYTISASVNPTAGGTVSGANTYNYGATATLIATANTGYTFANWTKNGTVVSTDASYSFTVTETAAYTANFTLNSYALTVAADPTEGGIVSGAGTYNHFGSATLTATPSTGYAFINWTKNGTVVSTDATYTFTVEAAGDYVAHFSQNSYAINAVVTPEGSGTVTGTGNYIHGATATLTATANEGYTFVNWTEGNTAISTDAIYSFTVEGSKTLKANFSLNSYAISTTANPVAGGTVSGAGTYNHGTSVTLNATANEGYYFVNWTKNGTSVSTSTAYSVNVTEAADYVANFELYNYEITATANPTAGGTVTGAGTYDYGTSATLTATANEGYYFVNWTKNGTTVSTSTSYTVNVTGAADYVANFSLYNYDITATANPTEGGTVTGTGNYEHFETATLTATANEGYYFVNWTKNGTSVSTSTTYSFNVTEAGSYVANFSIMSYNVTATANPTAGGTITGAGTYNHGTSATLNATANEGYYFVNWTKNGTIVSTSTSYTVNVTGAADYVANFELYSYEITATANPTAGGTVSGAGSYNHFETATLTATANENYLFTNWTLNGAVVSTEATYSFEVDGSKNLVANFTLMGVVATPTFSIASGIYNVAQQVTINCSTEGATIRYTTDGSNPTEQSTVFNPNQPIVTTDNGITTIKAIAMKENMTSSDVATAVYRIVPKYNVIISDGIVNGTVTANPTSDTTGAIITLTANPAEGYSFNNGWNVTNATTGLEINVVGNQFEMPASNVNVSANFILNSYAVTATANPTAGGSVTGTGTYNHNDVATLTASPAVGYSFSNWTSNGTVVSSDANYQFTVTRDSDLVANFTTNTYNVTLNTNGGTINSGNVTSYTYTEGATLPTDISKLGHSFGGWYDNANFNGNAITSISANETGDKTFWAKWTVNSYALTINYKYSNGTQAATTHTENVNYNTDYSVTSPAITGYTADQPVVSGTMGTEAVTVNVVYSINSYNLSVNYKYADGTPAATTHTESVNYNAAYSVTSPVITGYTASQATVSGTMGTEDVTVDVTYNINSYNLTINYKYSNGTQAAPTHTESVNYNVGYSVSSPAITGYTADQTVVSGTMGTADVTVNVVYNINSYALTINYKYSDGSPAATTHTENVNYNTAYSVISPTITGYTADQTVVSGTMGTAAVTVDVTYSINSYALTINYKYTNGTTAAPAHTENVNYNVAYSVTSPVLTGYTADQTVVSGTMGTEPVTVNVVYNINSYNLIINYKYADGSPAATTHTESVNYNAAYSVNSPVITGYTANQTVVSGTMGTADVTVDVVYSINSYNLTINYKYADGTQAAPAHSESINYNVAYSVTSPVITGYTADQAVVSGTMGTANVTVNVVYNINSYNLTIYYKYANGTTAATTHTGSVNYHVAYSVTSPHIDGYVASKTTVAGTMADNDLTVNVTYYQVTTNIVDATNCAGNGNGSITVTAPTGNFEYSLNGTNFQTSNIFNGLNANNYNLYIRPINDEYNYVGEWTVASVITMPIVSVASNDSVFCLNETIMLNGNGSSVGTEYSYAWSGPANYSSSEKNPASFIASNGNMSGTYTLTVTNTATQCASQKSLNIYVNDATNSNYVFTLSGFNAVGNVANGPAIVNIMRPVVTHFMDGIIENYTIDSVTLTNDALAEYTTVGEYPVTWTATDACGNTATCSIIVTITDTECPLVQDVDGNIYSTVKFGTTCWMNSNLKTTHYADGREITNVYKYYYQAYPNVDENVSIYGLLYDWYDAMDVTRPVRAARVQGICPDGWYLPNEDDFQQLNNIPVGDLRSTSYWLFNQGTNNSGFDLRPGGMYNHSTSRYENLHGNAYLWSAAEINSTEAHCHMADCHCYMIYDLIYNKLNAFSVRCVKGE